MVFWLNRFTRNNTIWAGGVIMSDPLVANLPCDHDKGGRIIVDNYLQVDDSAVLQ